MEKRKQDADLSPGFSITAEYRLGELRGWNNCLDYVLAILDGIERENENK